jgi:hypothetical protein
MSHRDNGSPFDNQRRAIELHDGPAHAHRVGEQHGQQEHLSGSEQSRQALEHSGEAHRQSAAATIGHGIAAFNHDDIAALAHQLWQNRGCPSGSPDVDWHRATEELRSRKV